jgi:hypothetical protein
LGLTGGVPDCATLLFRRVRVQDAQSDEELQVPEEKPVSLAPLDLGKALKGLLEVKPPDKAEKPKRKKKGERRK